CEGLARAYGAQVDVEFFQYYPATVNTPAETALCEAVIGDTFGGERLYRDVPPNMTSEDFGFMLEERPGAYVLIGKAPASVPTTCYASFSQGISTGDTTSCRNSRFRSKMNPTRIIESA
ncbi:M20/M25/M40 family metallo-hydrolase, partial [Burkholderia cepacia]